MNPRRALLVRLVGLAVISWTVINAHHSPGVRGRGIVVTICFAAAVVSWLAATISSWYGDEVTPDVFVLAVAGGFLTGAAPGSASSAFVFMAVVAAGIRVELARALPVVLAGAAALGISVILYDDSGLGFLAYTLGFAAALLAASNSRQSVVRGDQAELLLAQTQRSHEEQLRSARLEESTRIAREIHDVLAHALAGLTLHLEATTSLIEQGADSRTVLARVHRAHELAREGLRETRRAVGALRGDSVSPQAGIEALVADFRAVAESPVTLSIDGDANRLSGPTGEAVLRGVQEALTNVRKHAPGAGVSIAIHAGEAPHDEVVLVVEDRRADGRPAPAVSALASSGGGFGLRGMRERAQLLGGSLSAGSAETGWRVELRLPSGSTG